MGQNIQFNKCLKMQFNNIYLHLYKALIFQYFRLGLQVVEKLRILKETKKTQELLPFLLTLCLTF